MKIDIVAMYKELLKQRGRFRRKGDSLSAAIVGNQAIEEMERLIKAGYTLCGGTNDGHIDVAISWEKGQVRALIICFHTPYEWWYGSLQLFQNDQPCWDLSTFTLVKCPVFDD